MKLLFVTVSVTSYNTGDSIYSYGIMDRLSDCCNIDVLTYDTEIDNENAYYYNKLIKKVNSIYTVRMRSKDHFVKYFKYANTFVRYSDAMLKKINLLLKNNNYDCVVVDHLRMGFVIPVVQKYKCKIVLIQHNIETENYYEQIKLKGKVKYRIKNWGLPIFESNMLKAVDNIWCITESDMEYFKSLKGLENKKFDIVVPYFPYKRIKMDQIPCKKLVITGTMSWYPNIEGIEWFVEKVFSKLIKQDPEYQLYIVGRNPDERLKKLNSENIIVTGTVPSVDEYIKNCDLLIVPNKLGGGAKIKIIEGIFKGIPCLVLRPSISGYENAIPDEDFIIDNEDEFLKKILSINSDIGKKEKFVSDFQDNIRMMASLIKNLENI